MRRAIASAEVGDDVYGEDPTVRRLEARVAELLGKESALFVTSGTMANQLALLTHCRPGDEVVVSEGAHCAWYESGAGAALAGVQFVVAGTGPCFSPEALAAALKPDVYYYPRSRLVALENTHNRAGGQVLPQETVAAVARLAHDRGLAVHLDGARLLNASVASGVAPDALAAPSDSVSLCLSKGLGAPVGSLLAGSRDFVRAAHRFRKMLGGGMRQAGVLAAAGLYALDHNVQRLAEDHQSARLFAEEASQGPGLTAHAPETNIVLVDLPGDPRDAPAERFAARCEPQGLRLSVFGPARLRAVTHLDVTPAQAREAGRIVARVAAG
ncbi:MAG: aminotransferase class I/II-fold pyridoxal phosphate-dependent enzyme [Deltaproteobacteria bacterium]|nr:aminotransferase class I/II-fold pyridoxal phosphate-dependent enzyme [Deltaproteobacteria bacterium]